MAAVMDEGSLPVLTAVANAGVEAALVAGFGRQDLGVTVVRRCVDIVELLSAAAAGTARAALVSADLRGLDRESVELLSRSGLATVGLASDESDERLLHQLAVDLVLPVSAAPEQVAGGLRAAAETLLGAGVPEGAHLRGAAPLAAMTRRSDSESATSGGAGGSAGSLVAVWGPTGAPGRSNPGASPGRCVGPAGDLCARDRCRFLWRQPGHPCRSAGRVARYHRCLPFG